MKRILTFLSIIPLLGGALTAQAYTVKPGDTLSKIAQANAISLRGLIALNPGIKNPNLIHPGEVVETGHKEVIGANKGLLGGAGYTPVTGYQSRTTQYLSNTNTTIKVASTKDPAGNEIDLTNVTGSSTARVYLTLEPGSTREEIVMCTGKSVGQWSSCTRGLSFQGGDQSSSSTLAIGHNAGSIVIISNVGQFFNQYVSIDGNQTKNDLLTFNQFPRVTSTTAIPTNNAELSSKYYVDNVGAGGFTASNVSTTGGISVNTSGIPNCPSAAACISLNRSTTSSGLGLDGSGKVYVNVSSTQFSIDSNNQLSFNTAQGITFSGAVTFTGTTTVPYSTASSSAASVGYVISDKAGDGSDGDVTISASTQLTRDMYYNTLVINAGATVTSAGYRIYSRYSAVDNGAIVATGTNGANGAGGTGGASGTGALSGTLGGGGLGAAGCSNAGGGITWCGVTPIVLSQLGGAGGDGSGSGATVGGGLNSSPTPSSTVRSEMMIDSSSTYSVLKGGSGGGGGGAGNSGAAASAGGGGGGGGGLLWISTPTFSGSGHLWANGGNGGNGVGAGIAGGGGGGGGGSVILRAFVNSFSGDTLVNGGTGGSGSGGGNGANGTAGRIIRLTL
jgi:LysM repeat protein